MVLANSLASLDHSGTVQMCKRCWGTEREASLVSREQQEDEDTKDRLPA